LKKRGDRARSRKAGLGTSLGTKGGGSQQEENLFSFVTILVKRWEWGWRDKRQLGACRLKKKEEEKKPSNLQPEWLEGRDYIKKKRVKQKPLKMN